MFGSHCRSLVTIISELLQLDTVLGYYKTSPPLNRYWASLTWEIYHIAKFQKFVSNMICPCKSLHKYNFTGNNTHILYYLRFPFKMPAHLLNPVIFVFPSERAWCGGLGLQACYGGLRQHSTRCEYLITWSKTVQNKNQNKCKSKS